jgi:hypothetical protein
MQTDEMASETVSTMKFITGLRGYHVYRTSWKPFLKQQLAFKQEKDNKHDRFAVAGQTILPGTLLTRSKLKWAFPFWEKYDQIKGTPLKYTIFPSKIKLLNIFLSLYYKEN